MVLVELVYFEKMEIRNFQIFFIINKSISNYISIGKKGISVNMNVRYSNIVKKKEPVYLQSYYSNLLVY